MTRKELKMWEASAKHVKKGYCEYSNLPWDRKQKYVLIGTNSGTFGWNWSAYFSTEEDNTLIIDGYRNY